MWWHFEESEEGIRHQTVWELIPKVLRLFRQHLKYLYLAFFLLIPVTAAQLAGPAILKHVIDVSIPAGDIRGVMTAAGIYIAIVAGGAGVGYLQAITLFRLGINILTDLKSRMFEHVLNLGLEFHETHSPGKLLSRVESDTETLKQLFGDVLVNLTRNFLLFLGILAMLVYYNFSIAIWIVGLIPFLFGATFWYLIKMRPFWRELRAQWAIVIGYVTEYVQGIEVIQQFNYQNRAKSRMRDVNFGKYRIEVPAMFIEYGFWGAFLFGEIIAMIIILAIGIRQVFAGVTQIGVLIALIEYIRQLFFPIIQLSGQLNFIQRGLISVERIFGILEQEPSIVDGPRPAEQLTFEREIVFEDVWFAYEEDNWILRGVSFKIPKGQKIALVGPSGGGKSTIINLLLRFYDPQKGRITVDGQDIRDFPVEAWRGHVGLVLQDIYLFPGSVVDNLRVFDQAIPVERVKEVSNIARADTIVEKLPGRYEGELAEKGANLSVGERQLMSFARALVYDPPLLVLDEATSSVDPHTERLVQEALDRLLAGRTAVIVAHRLSTIVNSDHILVITGGQVVESGSHKELIEMDGIYAKLHRLQFQDLSESAKAVGRAS